MLRKNLLKILLVLGILFSGSTYLNAKDIYLSQQTSKDYGVLVKVYDELKSGVNEIKIFGVIAPIFSFSEREGEYPTTSLLAPIPKGIKLEYLFIYL